MYNKKIFRKNQLPYKISFRYKHQGNSTNNMKSIQFSINYYNQLSCNGLKAERSWKKIDIVLKPYEVQHYYKYMHFF